MKHGVHVTNGKFSAVIQAAGFFCQDIKIESQSVMRQYRVVIFDLSRKKIYKG